MASIVVIDSEETVRSVMEKILLRDGHTVRATGDFSSAMDWIRESAPDLVITNVFLRGIAGHDAMHKVRSEFPGLPVLMVSGLPDESIIQRWEGEADFDVFPKPFRSDALLNKVRQMIA